MYSFLPDELLKEILAPALRIPDISFASTAKTSPFAKYERSTSAYLLVCKDWLRVATPLLYDVVVLRSKAQIQALAWALKSTPELGTFIKKLRIECSYSAFLFAILQVSRNLTDLCLSLEIYSQDNISGICKGLALVHPRRIILYDPLKRTQAYNQNILTLVATLCVMIPKWTNLIAFILPDSLNWRFVLDFTLVDALCQSPSLQEIGYPYEDQSFITQLAKIPTLKKIFVRRGFWVLHGLESPLYQNIPEIVKKHPELAGLVSWRTDDPDELMLPRCSSCSSPKPIGIDSEWFQECPSVVLENILVYAMDIPELQDKDNRTRGKQWLRSFNLTYRQGLMLVCKRFYELGIRLFYQCILVQSGEDLDQFSRCYAARTELGEFTRSFFLLSDPFSSYDLRKLTVILSFCPNLRRVGYLDSCWISCGYPRFKLDWPVVSTLASLNSARLIDLEVHLEAECVPRRDLAILLDFTSLRSLHWYSESNFHFDPATISRSALCCLETLVCATRDETFLGMMNCLDLPRIDSVHFPKLEQCPGLSSFLMTHGSKLQYLETTVVLSFNLFETCPNLKVLILPHDSSTIRTGRGPKPKANTFTCSQDHFLEEIKINTLISGKGTREYFAFLEYLDLSQFKSLRRIRIFQCSWPTTEHEIKRSFWVPWAERLQRMYSVDITDGSGKPWIPRLKVKGRGGK